MFLKRNPSLFYDKKSNDFLFPQVFVYWKNTLLEYAERLFTVEGWGDPRIDRFFKSYLLLDGKCGATNNSRGVFCVGRASLYGVSNYPDEYPSMLVNLVTEVVDCRDYYNEKNAVLIKNNSLMNGLRAKIDLYAMLLTHCDLSLKVGLINERDMRLYEAIQSNNTQGIRQFLRKKENGENAELVNTGFALARVTDATNHTTSLDTIYDIRGRLLSQYLEDIGVRRRDTKKERLITDEVQADSELLVLNVLDMYDYWSKGLQEINDLWGYDLKLISNVDLHKGGVDN